MYSSGLELKDPEKLRCLQLWNIGVGLLKMAQVSI